MPEQNNNVEEQIAAIVATGFTGEQQDEPTADQTQGDRQERKIIDVNLFRLPDGGILLLPTDAANPLDKNAVDSIPTSTEADVEEYTVTHTPTQPLTPLTQQEQNTATPLKRKIRPAYILLPLMLLLFLAASVGTDVYILPLTATADITITPVTRTLEQTTTLTIGTPAKAGQIQGRSLQGVGFTKSVTVPATGKGHQDAAQATGEITFYNTDLSPVTIPAGVTFSVNGIDIVTDNSVTINAATPPLDSQASTYAHAVQTGVSGNIPAKAIYTKCCQASVIAMNILPFRGGQDARDYTYIQSSDIQNAASDLLPPLTNKVTAALTKQAHPGESIVTPLCAPHTISSEDPGTQALMVTVNVTQICTGVLYQLASLEQVGTAFLAQSQNLTKYEQVGTVQVTVNGSTVEKATAKLHVSLYGIWVYQFTQHNLIELKHLIAGKRKTKAKDMLQTHPGVEQVTISLHRFDLRTELPTNINNISVLVV